MNAQLWLIKQQLQSVDVFFLLHGTDHFMVSDCVVLIYAWDLIQLFLTANDLSYEVLF